MILTGLGFALTYQVNVFFFYIKSINLQLSTNAVLSKKGSATNGFNLVFHGVKKISLDTYFHFYSIGLFMGPVRMESVFALRLEETQQIRLPEQILCEYG